MIYLSPSQFLFSKLDIICELTTVLENHHLPAERLILLSSIHVLNVLHSNRVFQLKKMISQHIFGEFVDAEWIKSPINGMPSLECVVGWYENSVRAVCKSKKLLALFQSFFLKDFHWKAEHDFAQIHTLQNLCDITFRQKMLKHFRSAFHSSQECHESTVLRFLSGLGLFLFGSIFPFQSLWFVIPIMLLNHWPIPTQFVAPPTLTCYSLEYSALRKQPCGRPAHHRWI